MQILNKYFTAFLSGRTTGTSLDFYGSKTITPPRMLWNTEFIFYVFGNRPTPVVAIYGLRLAAVHEWEEIVEKAKQFIQYTGSSTLTMNSSHCHLQLQLLVCSRQPMLAISNLRLKKIASNCRLICYIVLHLTTRWQPGL